MKLKTVWIQCDGVSSGGRCNAQRQAKILVSVLQLRMDLARVGWICDNDADRDYCPLHARESVRAS